MQQRASPARKNPAICAEASIAFSWNTYTARDVAICTRLGRYDSPFLNAGRVSVSQPPTLSWPISSAARPRADHDVGLAVLVDQHHLALVAADGEGGHGLAGDFVGEVRR